MARSPIKSALLREPRRNRVIVLEDLNFIWDQKELIELTKMWEQGKSVIAISSYFDRDPDEIILALMHLAKEERITSRKGGLFGVG